MRRAELFRLPAAGPDDVSALEAAIESGLIDPGSIVAILGKTEGNGCVNDFTRGYAVKSFRQMLATHLPTGRLDRIAMVMSGGTEGGLSPHWLVFAVTEVAPGPAIGSAMAVSVAHTRALLPEEIGRMAQVEAVAETVRAAVAEAGIDSAADVHYVQVKCPLLTASRVGEALARGNTTATTDTLKSMGLSRGASALGVASALGEIAPGDVSDAVIGVDMSLYSGRASCSAGIELMTNEVMVLGNSTSWTGPLRIGHAVMRDAIDVAAGRQVLDGLGLAGSVQPVAVLAKAEASRTGLIRGERHTMLDDSDVSATRHARAFVGGVLAGLVGNTALFVSGGAEHQGPDGGGPVAMIARDSTG